jgi:hypothetical protein
MEPLFQSCFSPWFWKTNPLALYMEYCFSPWFEEPESPSLEPQWQSCFSPWFGTSTTVLTISRSDFLPIVLDWLVDTECNKKLLDCGWKKSFFNLRGYCVGEFVRQKLIKEYSDWKLPNCHKSACTTEVELWLKVYDLIEKVFELYPGTYKHPALWFYAIIQERALVLFRNFQNSDNKGKDDYIARIQRQNKQLLTLEANPFDSQTALHTWQLIDRAITIADQGSDKTFRSKIFTPMVRARMALTTYVAAPGSELLIDGEYGVDSKNKGGRKPEKQWRQKARKTGQQKAKNKNFNTSSETFSGKGFQG